MTRLARVLLVALVATLALAGLAAPARAGGSQAVVIVDTGGTTYTRVISFSGTISGLQALSLAGASPVTSVYGGEGYAVCQLFGVGNEADSCLGTPSDPRYWAYYRGHQDSGWRYSGTGAAGTTVSDGDVEGWRFGGGAPGFRSFCDVVGCAPPPAPPPDPDPVPAAPGGGTAGTPAPGAGPTAGLPTGAAATTDVAAASPDATAPVSDPAVTAPPTTAPTGGSRETRRTDARALGGGPVVADDDGSGSPAGVLVALAVVVAIAGVAVVLRRRGRTPG